MRSLEMLTEERSDVQLVTKAIGMVRNILLRNNIKFSYDDIFNVIY